MFGYELVITHYHLNRGGVTRVIEGHLRSLASLPSDQHPSRVLIVSGGRDSGWDSSLADKLPFPLQVAALELLEYDSQQDTLTSVEALYGGLTSLLKRHGFRHHRTVLHVHNHSLGKVAALPGTLERLANDGWRMLLQIHDFAEDQRPENYRHLVECAGGIESLQSQLYPQANHLHYSVLTRSDADLLANSGLDRDRLHLLPNPVSVRQKVVPMESERRAAARKKLSRQYDVEPSRPYVLYPVRGIRRKNLGELLLWAALCDHATFGLTLAPVNPVEKLSYDRWTAFSQSLSLSVLFNVGNNMSLEESYVAADAILTTSVAEGFGMVFLEGCLARKPLFGRDIPGVTADFRQHGLQFPNLIDSLLVPQSLIDVGEFLNRQRELLAGLRNSYGVAASEDDSRISVDVQFDGDTIDFGRLDSGEQRRVVEIVRRDANVAQTIRELNPVVSRLIDSRNDTASMLDANIRAIEDGYAENVIGSTLHHTYESVLASDLSRVLRRSEIAAAVLQGFFVPDRFFAVRLES